MYLEFFGFGRAPFGGPVEPSELFLAETHREALATFVYGIVSRKPIIMVTGDVGVGKTTVLRTALTHLLEEPLVIIEVPHPLLKPDEVVREIAQALKMERAQELTIAKLERVHDAIKELCATGKRIIFIVDEAQEMPHETLEFIRLMSNMEVGVTGRFQIILVGQTELERTLAKPHFRHLRQRVALRGNLRPLSPVDAADYLRHRIELAGGHAESILTPGAVKRIVRASKGIPRRINAITDNALLLAFGAGTKPVTASNVSEAVADLDRGMRYPWLSRYGQPIAIAVGVLLLLIGAGSILLRPNPLAVPQAAPVAGDAAMTTPPAGEPAATIGAAPSAAPASPATAPSPAAPAAQAAPSDAGGPQGTAQGGEFYQDTQPAPAMADSQPAAPAPVPEPRGELASGPAASPVAPVAGVSGDARRPQDDASTRVASAAPADRPATTGSNGRGSSRSASAAGNAPQSASSGSDRASADGAPTWLPYAHRLEPGETVRDVLMRAYGSYNQDVLFLFHALNSELADPESAGTGDVIWVPVRKDRESGFFLSDSRP